MFALFKLFRCKLKKHRSPLRAELDNLEVKIYREDIRLAELNQQFLAEGGVCCPSCGIPGYSDAVCAQDRRRARVCYLKAKLAGGARED